MPCDQYELHLQNSVVDTNGNPDVAVASLAQSISTVTAVQLGHINVVLDHKSILLTDRTRRGEYLVKIQKVSFCEFGSD